MSKMFHVKHSYESFTGFVTRSHARLRASLAAYAPPSRPASARDSRLAHGSYLARCFAA